MNYYMQYLIKNGNKVDVYWLPDKTSGGSLIKIGDVIKIDTLEPSEGWSILNKYANIKISEEKINTNRDASRDFKTISIAGRKSYKDG